MNGILQEIFSSGLVHDEAGRPHRAFPAGVRMNIGMTLYDLIGQSRAETSLEIGMAYGVSSLFLCQAHQDKGFGRHVVIDPRQTTAWDSIGLLNIRRAGLESIVEFHDAPSHEVLPALVGKGESFDFVFIDGMHLFDFTLIDFFYSDLLLKIGGYIVFDDIWMPSIRKVVDFILRNRSYQLSPEDIWSQSGILNRAIAFASGLRKEAPLRQRLKRLASYSLRNPLDLSSLASLLRFSVQGGLDCCVLRKVGSDERDWLHFRAF